MGKNIYSLYKTTNLVNGIIYIGIHRETRYPEIDGYLGSGIHLNSAINKYGRQAFTREFLVISDSKEYIMELERLYVNAEFVLDRSNCNHHCGGSYAYIPKPQLGEDNSFYGKKHSDDSKKKMSDSAKNRKPIREEARKKMSEFQRTRVRKPYSDEAKKKMSISASNRVRPPMSDETKKKIGDANRGRIGHKHTEEAKRKISEAGKNRKPISEETRRKLSNANKGKTLTAEHRKKLSEAAFKRHSDK